MNSTDHLSEEQIFDSVLEEASLADEVRGHLAGCPVCREKRTLLEGSLTRFGREARTFSPSPLGRPDLSTVDARRARGAWWKWYWRAAIPAAMAAGLALFFIAGNIANREHQREMAFLSDKETVEDEQLLAEVWRLEENAIPPVYLDMSGMRDADAAEPSSDDLSLKGTRTNDAPGACVPNGTVS